MNATLKLRLGPLPRTETVKLTVTLSVELKNMLDRYAELHARTWDKPVDTAMLVPHMLATFMERDRGFKALRHGSRLPGAGGESINVRQQRSKAG